MERKRQIPGPNGPLDGTEVGFRSTGEYWNEYLLDDGSVVRVKIVVTGFLRLEGEFDALGQPVYAVKSENVIGVSAPDELMKRSAEEDGES